MRYKRGALVGLVAAGGGSYAAYELTDTAHPLSYTLEPPVMTSLAVSEDVSPVVNALIYEIPQDENSGIQPSDSDSLNVMSISPSSRPPESKDPSLERDKNTATDAPPTPEEIRKPSESGDAPVVQTNSRSEDRMDNPVVAPAKPDEQPTKIPKESGPSPKNPKSRETERNDARLQIQTQHKRLASSYGLTHKDNYDAQGLDNFNGDPNSAIKVKTFVVGEDAEYMKRLWTNSIAIKHRRYWNLAPDNDPIWEQQLASAQKRIRHHSDGSGDMYAYVFGSFSLNRNGRWEHLNAKNLARRCKENLERTPWGTWWSAARARYWILLWDFCAKPDLQAKGIPWNIDYWYRNQTGDRKDSDFK